MIGHAKRITLVILGLFFLGLGAIGVFVPLLPTTPFVLLAAVAFANSSERLHQWLLDHKVFGPLIKDWRQYGAIKKKTKVISVISMIAIILISWLSGVANYVILIQAIVLSASATYVLTRPLPPRETAAEPKTN